MFMKIFGRESENSSLIDNKTICGVLSSLFVLNGCGFDFDYGTPLGATDTDEYRDTDAQTVEDTQWDLGSDSEGDRIDTDFDTDTISNPPIDTGSGPSETDSEDDQSSDSSSDPITNVFTTDDNVLAVFELNGDVKDTSGNGRHGLLIGGAFVETAFGKGLKMGGDPQGFSWGESQLIKTPFTIEMVLIPSDMSDYEKLFGFNDGLDNGWYYLERAFKAWPNGRIGSGFEPNTRHYLAMVSSAENTINVYLNGKSIGTTSASFTGSLDQAIFFRDDTATKRSEFFKGVADAVRISSVARSLEEIQQVQALLNTQPI